VAANEDCEAEWRRSLGFRTLEVGGSRKIARARSEIARARSELVSRRRNTAGFHRTFGIALRGRKGNEGADAASLTPCRL
jgi:hypothetical protein